MKECRFYQKVDGEGEYASDTVRCELCPHCCVILEGKHGKCGSRWNFNGMLYSIVYGKPCALADDPVEKKPLNEFHPGTRCLSLSCTGCNFRCLNCQNHDISQVLPSAVDFYELSPSDIVDIAVKHHMPGIAYTYTEPLREIVSLIDAANIDLKAFSEDVYQKQCGGHLQPVLDTLLTMKKAGVHLEITNLLIPGVNDSESMIRDMCSWLRDNGFADCPLHFSRFFPQYKMQDSVPTPTETLFTARRIAQEEGMRKIYLGNI